MDMDHQVFEMMKTRRSERSLRDQPVEQKKPDTLY